MDIKQKHNTLDMQTKLSTLWIFILLNMIFRDIHEFVKPEFLKEMMTGVVNGVQITEGLMLLGGIMIEIVIIMVLLSRLLKHPANRWANILVSPIAIMLIVMNNTAPDLDDIFFATIEVAALLLIIWFAWKWPKPAGA